MAARPRLASRSGCPAEAAGPESGRGHARGADQRHAHAGRRGRMTLVQWFRQPIFGPPRQLFCLNWAIRSVLAGVAWKATV